MKSFIIPLLSLALLGGSSAVAQEKPATVDAVLEKYVKAIGGKEAWEKVESRQIKATLEVNGASSEWTLDAKAPNKRATAVEIEGFGPILEGFDGTIAWQKTQGGVRAREGDELARAKREADFRREIRLKELYPDLESKGTEMFNGKAVQVLEAKPSASSKERFSFSAETGLLVRAQSEFQTPDGNQITLETELSDYRDVDGIKYPHAQKVAILAGGQPVFDFSVKVKEIKHNGKIEDSKFAKPAE